MTKSIYTIFILFILLSASAIAQRPPGGGPPGGGPPGGGPPRDMGGPPRVGGQFPGDGPRQPGRNGGPGQDDRRGGWVKSVDTSKNGNIELQEIVSAGQRTFNEFDKNQNGIIEAVEFRQKPEDGDAKKILPPIFFSKALENGESVSREEFDKAVQAQFERMDRNRDGVIDKDESRFDGGPGRPEHPMQPNAQFVAAELRFGDKLIIGQPFSAEMQIEDTRRLFDGTTVTKRIAGATYRDSAGRTRREQPIDIGGISLVGSDNKPQTLIFINDFAARVQYFIDNGNRVARKSGIAGGPPPDQGEKPEGKVEDLGTKEIEGIRVTGTRTTFEIPAGQLGNDKPIPVVTENWFSPELQVIVFSKHSDPLAGEHVFRLVNIKRDEPSPDLFQVPAGFKVVGKPEWE